MGNDTGTKIKRILTLVEGLPYFTLNDLLSIEKNKDYLKILLFRYEKKGIVIRLKKGVYVCERYFLSHIADKERSFYYEFISNIIYSPSYLSIDYVLYQYNLITEIPVNFTSVTQNKTAVFSNKFGNFFYHKIKDPLFCGFDIIKKGNLTIFKATKAKALFDFLYFKKNSLIDKRAIEELRLNLEHLTPKDIKELENFVLMDNSKNMKEILNVLIKLWKH